MNEEILSAELLNNITNHKIKNSETLTRILLYEIRERNPNAIRFVISPSVVKTVLLHIVLKNFDTLMYIYGHQFLIELLKVYEEFEVYENCDEIKKQIELHNKLTNDKLKTK
jgi:hypothetical protein